MVSSFHGSILRGMRLVSRKMRRNNFFGSKRWHLFSSCISTRSLKGCGWCQGKREGTTSLDRRAATGSTWWLLVLPFGASSARASPQGCQKRQNATFLARRKCIAANVKSRDGVGAC
ncbi:uncharacterized protein LOC124692333 isoform X2 [Lolium rigidum]|nr:uncharacterized protein LOC124692333 isoform X2 [Lolium rigidum]